MALVDRPNNTQSKSIIDLYIFLTMMFIQKKSILIIRLKKKRLTEFDIFLSLSFSAILNARLRVRQDR